MSARMRARARHHLLAGWVVAGSFACAPRQAVIETDPRGGAQVRRQLEATVRSDLDALRRAQEDFRSRASVYTYELAELGFEPSAGVSLSVVEATENGFAAIARAGSVECTLFVGSADPPRAYATTRGVPACRAS